MMLQKYLESRYITGNSSVTRPSPALDVSFLLTKLKNYNTDEYATVDNDGMSVPPLACAFAKMPQNQHVVGVVDEDGYLVLYDTHKTGQGAVIKSWQAHANAVFDLEWLTTENKILTGSGDQTIALFDAETCQKISTFKGHASSIKSISSRVGDDAVSASGSRDGHIMIWDRRIFHKDNTVPPVDTIFNAHTLQHHNVTSGRIRKKHQSHIVKDAQQSVTTVLFQNENYLISAGAVDGCLKVWDMRKTYKRRTTRAQPAHIFQYSGVNTRKHGFSSLVQDSLGRRLFANCTDDVIYEYDMAAFNPKPIGTWRGHKNSTFYIKSALSSDDQYLLSGSSDEMAYIWQINNPDAAPIILKSHTAEVTGVAWCPNDFTKIVTLSDDTKTKFWRIYCRELKKQLLPPWIGKAKVISKRSETSRIIDTQSPTTSTPSTLNNSASSPQLCLRTWLKRKAKSTEPSNDQDVPPEKSFCRYGCPKTDKKIDTTTNADDAATSTEDSSAKSDEMSSCSTSSSDCGRKKRSHDELENMSSPDVFQAQPCATCYKDEQCNDMPGENITLKKLKTEQAKINLNDGIITKEVTSAKEDKSLTENIPILLLNENLQSPQKTMQTSPLKQQTSPLKQQTSTLKHKSSPRKENIPVHSPRKLIKRMLSSSESPVTSPKRPCLTNLESNRLQVDVSSVKISLFMDQTFQGDNTPSNNNISHKNSEPFSKITKVEKMVERSDSCINSDCVSQEVVTLFPLSPSKSSQEQCPFRASPAKEVLNSMDNSVMLFQNAVSPQISKESEFDSPTRNLPNLVLDEAWGSSVTPPKSKSARNQKHNWLTQIRLDKLKKCTSNVVPKPTNQGKLSPKVTKGMRKINSYFK